MRVNEPSARRDLRRDDEHQWQRERAASRQRTGNALHRRPHLNEHETSGAFRSGSGVHLPPIIMRASSSEAAEIEVRQLVADIDSCVTHFADIEAELRVERAAHLQRQKQEARKQRSPVGKALQHSKSENALFFDVDGHRQQRHVREGAMPARGMTTGDERLLQPQPGMPVRPTPAIKASRGKRYTYRFILIQILKGKGKIRFS